MDNALLYSRRQVGHLNGLVIFEFNVIKSLYTKNSSERKPSFNPYYNVYVMNYCIKVICITIYALQYEINYLWEALFLMFNAYSYSNLHIFMNLINFVKVLILNSYKKKNLFFLSLIFFKHFSIMTLKKCGIEFLSCLTRWKKYIYNYRKNKYENTHKWLKTNQNVLKIDYYVEIANTINFRWKIMSLRLCFFELHKKKKQINFVRN